MNTVQRVSKGLVSIAIPAYKKTFIRQAIESALSQDYTQIELIIVNDKSPYDLKQIVDEYKDNRIRYYENTSNLGRRNVVDNWNRCLELAKGEFFVLLCDDDILLPGFVSQLLQLASKYPRCNVFHARRIVRSEKSQISKVDSLWPEWESLSVFYENKLKWERLHTITEFLYRTSHIKELKYIPFPMAWGSDDISVMNFAKEGGIASSKEPLAIFRENEEHISRLDYRIVEKAKARILNFYWCGSTFKGNARDSEYMSILSQLMVDFVKTASFFNKFRIVAIVPLHIWPLQRKIKECAKIIIGKRRHPGYRCLGV